MRFLGVVFGIVLLGGCAAHVPKTAKESSEHLQQKTIHLHELQQIPQDVSTYLYPFNKGKIATIQQFVKHYFHVWNIKKPSVSLKDASWAYTTYSVHNSFDYTYKPMPKSFFVSMKTNSNFQSYGTLNLYGVTATTTSLRSMPTDKPLFLDPQKAGEGYPFDYMQNSLIAANKPLLISHYSKDKKWVFVESSFGFGWLHVHDVVVIPKRYTKRWQDAKQVFLAKEGVDLYDEDGNYLFTSRIGMVLPMIQEDKKSFTVLGVTKDAKGQPFYHRVKISKEVASQGVLEFSDLNVAKVLQEVQKTQYGWGGLYKQRDCSSTLRDFFTPFGIWLPRNSSKQSKVGKIVKLAGLSNEHKLQIIKEKAIPFQTLLYKKGHIGLYVGTFKGEAVMFQNVWGVKTKDGKREGRFVVGKPVFSTLELGSELPNFDANASMLSKLQSFNILF